ncbi:187-kDa microtubule-associated protein AIR9-like protein [Drosera capensis]
MEDPDGASVQDALADLSILKKAEHLPADVADSAKKVTKTARKCDPVVSKDSGNTKRGMEIKSSSTLKQPVAKSGLTGPSRTLSLGPATRRNSTGGLMEKQAVAADTEQINSVASVGIKKSSPSLGAVRRTLPEAGGSSLRSSSTKEARKPSSVFPDTATPVTPTSSAINDKDLSRQPSFSRSTFSSSLKASSISSESTACSISKRVASKLSSPSAQTPSPKIAPKSRTKLPSNSASSASLSSELKKGSLSSPLDRSCSAPSRKKPTTPESRDSRFIMLPQVEVKGGDDVRLDLRGHKIRSLSSSGMNLSPNLEFVYLRDNLLASLESIENLKRVKVLDLSFNDFKEPGFEPLGNCELLQELYLAGNHIVSLASLPELANLEFLSVAQNKLKSLTMASQPRLQVLAASKNKISTLKGFPYLPVLEHLSLEENPILRMPHLEAASILVVGPTLKKFNDRDLLKEEVAIAKKYPAHTALCIRDGWEFCSPEQAADSTFHFLVEHWKDQLPPGFQLKEASIDAPFVEDLCRCHFLFAQFDGVESKLVLKYRWYIGESAISHFVAIPEAITEVYCPKREDITKLLKVECIPSVEETEYPPIFAISLPVSPGTGCPKVLNLGVRGDLVEGNIIRGYPEIAWCGGTPGKGVASWLRRRWNCSPVVIPGAEEEEYQLTLDDVDSSLVFMYTPITEEGAKGEPQYAITDYIKAAPPSVSNVRIIGDLVEGESINGSGDYFGGREGPSKFEWSRENKDTGSYGDFELVLAGAPEYNLTRDDVGCSIAFVYIPINFEGKEGESVSVVSDVVREAPPSVTNLKLIGDLREGSKVTATGTVTGGTEGSCRVQWFKSSVPVLNGDNALEVLTTSKIAKAFRVPLGAVGYYIVAKFTPMTPDGEAGIPAYAISDKTVETLPPNLSFLSITGDYVEGEILTASYGYMGGHEGKSIYSWYLHESEIGSGDSLLEVSGLLQYRISKDAIGKFVSFECTPVCDDGTMGEPKMYMGQERVRAGSPRLLSLQLNGKPVEGSTLHVDKKYWGGDEGDTIFRWFRNSSDGDQTEIQDASSAAYVLSVDDIGFYISVLCEPVRSDGVHGSTVLSETLGPIVPGLPTCQALQLSGSLVEGQRISFTASYSGGVRGDCCYEWFRLNGSGIKEKLCESECLDLAIEDVGCSVEFVFTPVRSDRVRGLSRSILSDVIAPADPIGLELTISDCYENEVVVLQKRYFGGQEGDGEYIWYRTKDRLYGSTLLEISDSLEGVSTRGKGLSYAPSLNDVGFYLALYWVPTRADGKRGQPLVSICSTPVAAAHPVMSGICVKEVSLGVYFGEGTYFGGHEGSSLFSWYRETADGTINLIPEADSRTYEVTDSDYTCRLYTPVRSDSVVGEIKLSEPTDIILPEIPKIEDVALTGKAIEGNVLKAVEVIPSSERQQHVWNKYKKEVRYRWYVSSDSASFHPLSSQRSSSYRVRFEDIGQFLKCELIVSDVFGRSSEPAFAETSRILPGIPRIDKLEIEGRGFHTNLYAVKGTYSGGKEGKSRVQWLRSMVGSPDLISIQGETGRMYEANVDDVGYRLVAVYTPVREDGVEGRPTSVSTEPIVVEPDVLLVVKKKLDLGLTKFEDVTRFRS